MKKCPCASGSRMDGRVSLKHKSRAEREMAHSRRVDAENPEKTWGWSSTAGRLRAARRGMLIAEAARLGPEVNALEIGCGTGLFTEMFIKTGASLIAVDISSQLLNKAMLRGLPKEQVRFVRGAFEELVFESRFDAIVGSSVLHHLEIETAIPKIHEALKPGGFIAFAEPNLLNPQIFLERKFAGRGIFSFVSVDETAFLRTGIKRNLERAGFIEVSVQPFDWLHPSLHWALIPFVRRIGTFLEKVSLIREFAGSLLISARNPI